MEYVIGYVNFCAEWAAKWGLPILTAVLIYFTYALWRATETYVKSTRELVEESKNEIEALKELSNAITRFPGNFQRIVGSKGDKES